MIFVGVDWARTSHDVTLLDESGAVLAHFTIADTLQGVGELHSMIANHVDVPDQVVIAIETPHGLLVQALVAAGYALYAVNPKASSRYRDRHAVGGAKSDAGDSKMLADLVRTDRHNHRRYVGDSELAASIKVRTRAHKDLVWARQRQFNLLRSTLQAYYPTFLKAVPELISPLALPLLQCAATPADGRAVSVKKIRAMLSRAGCHGNLDERARSTVDILRSPQLEMPGQVTEAYASTARALVAMLTVANQQIKALEQELAESFEEHPDAEIIRSLPGLGVILGARMLAEFGDDPTRYADAKARKNYAGTSPLTRASGTKRSVTARRARNSWLADACDRWAFASLAPSPGARRYYHQLRARQQGHHAALRMLANRWVGILHACLRDRRPFHEDIAWPPSTETAA